MTIAFAAAPRAALCNRSLVSASFRSLMSRIVPTIAGWPLNGKVARHTSAGKVSPSLRRNVHSKRSLPLSHAAAFFSSALTWERLAVGLARGR